VGVSGNKTSWWVCLDQLVGVSGNKDQLVGVSGPIGGCVVDQLVGVWNWSTSCWVCLGAGIGVGMSGRTVAE